MRIPDDFDLTNWYPEEIVPLDLNDNMSVLEEMVLAMAAEAMKEQGSDFDDIEEDNER